MDGFLDRFNFSYSKDSSPKDRAEPQFRRGSQDSDENVNDYIPYHDVSNRNQTNVSLEENDQNLGNLNEINNVGTLRAGEEVEVGGANVIIEKFLAEGGNAHVYIAAVMPSSLENTQTNPGLPPNRCVLKRIAVPDKASLLPIDKEIEAMKKLQGNPNIVEFYASSTRPLSKALSKGQRGYEAFILMEYCTEGTLVEFMKLREASMFSEPEVLYFFHEICLGVAAMHSQTPKIVHRDLKVENVLITNTQKLKLCDFGSSTTELIAPEAAISVAQAQVLEDELAACTTLQYRAPEMLDLFQRRGLTEKLDIWALGVLLYKLCYFKTPFDDEGPLAILNCRYTFPPTPVYSQPLLKLIKTMLQENPSSRPPVEKIIIEVCRLRGVQPTVSEPESVLEITVELKPTTSFIHPASVLAPVVPQPDLLFNPDAITPMRRGRPTRQKPSKVATNVFAPTSDDPFEMIAAGLDISKPSDTGSPWELPNPSPKVAERGSFWSSPPDIKTHESAPKVPPRRNNLNADPIFIDSNHPKTLTPPIPPPKPRNLKLVISPPQSAVTPNLSQSSQILPPPKPPRHRNQSSATRRQ